jgi:GNAT superfamily N-acetyltransferase
MPQRPLQARDAVASATFRDATHDDVAALVAVINPAYKRADGHIFANPRCNEDDLRERLGGGESRLVVAELDGSVAGCAQFETGKDGAHFGLLATALEQQGRGVARALIAHLEREALAAGCATMRIEIIGEVGLQPYYESLGYRVTAITPGDEWPGGSEWDALRPWTMVEMEKDLR